MKKEFIEKHEKRRSLRDALLIVTAVAAHGENAKSDAIPINLREPANMETAKLELACTAVGGTGGASVVVYAQTFDASGYGLVEIDEPLTLTGVASGTTERVQKSFDALPQHTYAVQGYFTEVTNASINFGVAV